MVTGHDFAMHLRSAYLTMHRVANAQFAKFGVTADQFVLLTALAREDAVTQQELVRRSSSDPNTVRAVLIRLEKQGLVAREPHATDGRALSVVLTERGRQLQEELWAVNQSFQGNFLALFAPEEMTALLAYLDRIAKSSSATKKRSPRSRNPRP